MLNPTPDFVRLAGSISLPAPKRDTTWADVIRHVRAARAAQRIQSDK